MVICLMLLLLDCVERVTFWVNAEGWHSGERKEVEKQKEERKIVKDSWKSNYVWRNYW